MTKHRPAAIRPLLAALVLLATTAVARAGGPTPGGPPGAHPHHPDPIANALFPPELIMGHQSELGISAQQRLAIMKSIEATQAKVLQVQWKLASESTKLAHLLGASRIDENRALAQADRVMNLERAVKEAHLRLLIRIKNTLTPAQQQKLAALRGR